MPLVAVDIDIDGECVGLDSLIVDGVEAGFAYVREIKLYIVVAAVIFSPYLGGDNLGHALAAVRIYFQKPCGSGGSVVLVKLGYSHLLLGGRIADLREADVGGTDPVLGDAGLQIPLQHLAGLAGRKERAEHEHTVLGQMAAVIDADFEV